MKRNILFLTGTRADFGKLKSLIQIASQSADFEVKIFATGMHMHYRYGYTVNEIEKSGFKNIFKFINYTSESSMDLTLAKTIDGLSSYIREERPDIIVVHGDRVEALAGAIAGALNNILVAHIEGGEVSGTIDELIRHAVTKMSHTHFVANEIAKKRLLQLGEQEESIYVIGSPDIDLMFSDKLPALQTVKEYYEIPFEEFALVLFHPVTTEENAMGHAANTLVDVLLERKENFVVIYPNNDFGSASILEAYTRLQNHNRFCVFPSLRFEYFLTLLKHALFVIGNSSAGIREAPYYGIPSVNIGSRQNMRTLNQEIINCDYGAESIRNGISEALRLGRYPPTTLFGEGKSDVKFLEVVTSDQFWKTPKQKYFRDLAR